VLDRLHWGCHDRPSMLAGRRRLFGTGAACADRISTLFGVGPGRRCRKQAPLLGHSAPGICGAMWLLLYLADRNAGQRLRECHLTHRLVTASNGEERPEDVCRTSRNRRAIRLQARRGNRHCDDCVLGAKRPPHVMARSGKAALVPFRPWRAGGTGPAILARFAPRAKIWHSSCSPIPRIPSSRFSGLVRFPM
jgi:hypothetical protein